MGEIKPCGIERRQGGANLSKNKLCLRPGGNQPGGGPGGQELGKTEYRRCYCDVANSSEIL
jgi:hypothetical protein